MNLIGLVSVPIVCVAPLPSLFCFSFSLPVFSFYYPAGSQLGEAISVSLPPHLVQKVIVYSGTQREGQKADNICFISDSLMKLYYFGLILCNPLMCLMLNLSNVENNCSSFSYRKFTCFQISFQEY